jgi:hypothetical protein
MQPCGCMCPRPKGLGAKRKVGYAHRMLDLLFFPLSVLLLILYDVTFTVTAMI